MLLRQSSVQQCSRGIVAFSTARNGPFAAAAAAAAAPVTPSAAAAPVAALKAAAATPGNKRTQHSRIPQQQRCSCTTAAAAGQASDPPTQSSSISIYDRPQLYDDAFSYRDFKAEAKFLQGAYQRHASPGGKLRTVLELGCGPANHATQLAKRGVQAWALDSNPHMLQYAAKKAAAAGVTNLQPVQGDMTQFNIKGMEGKLDMVVCMLGTLSHMLDNKQAAAAFRQAAKHLRPGGLLLLELAHPGDLFDGSLLLQDIGAELWEVERQEGPKLTVMWGTDVDDFDPQTQVLYRTVSIHEQQQQQQQEGETEGLGKCLLEEVVPYRQFTVQEIDLLATLTGLEVVGVYGDLDLSVSLTHEDAFRMVLCMRKLEQQ